VASHQFATEWMEDFEKYQEALEADQTYAATLSRSLSMVLDEFYQNLSAVGVSALTGLGMDEFFKVGGEYRTVTRTAASATWSHALRPAPPGHTHCGQRHLVTRTAASATWSHALRPAPPGAKASAAG
jgi:hypothetical protein